MSDSFKNRLLNIGCSFLAGCCCSLVVHLGSARELNVLPVVVAVFVQGAFQLGVSRGKTATEDGLP